MRPFLLSLIILTSCTVPDKASLAVMRQTRSSRKSPVTLSAKGSGKATNDKLELRANNSFAYQSNITGKQKCVFYAGTFTKSGDTLALSFVNNYKDSLWTGKAVIDTAKGTITIISTDTSFNKQLRIASL